MHCVVLANVRGPLHVGSAFAHIALFAHGVNIVILKLLPCNMRLILSCFCPWQRVERVMAHDISSPPLIFASRTPWGSRARVGLLPNGKGLVPLIWSVWAKVRVCAGTSFLLQPRRDLPNSTYWLLPPMECVISLDVRTPRHIVVGLLTNGKRLTFAR